MPHLVPGHHLYRVEPSDWRYVTPELTFHRITGPEPALAALDRVLCSGAAAEFDTGSDEAQLLAALAERGAVTTEPARPATSAGPIALAGRGPVADALAAATGHTGTVIVDADDDDALGTASGVLVVCEPFQRDRRWRAIDERRSSAGLAWHRVFLEGDTIVVGPFSVPGGVSYRDYCARRRAASGFVDELDRLWRHLDDAPATASITWPDAGLCAVAAGLVLHDIDRHARGLRAPGASAETTIGTTDGAVVRHPVLPLPAGITA